MSIQEDSLSLNNILCKIRLMVEIPKTVYPTKSQTEGDWKRQPGTGLKTMRTRYDVQAHKSNLELLLFFYPIWTISS